MELQLPKGTRDLPPEKAIIKEQILDLLKETFKLYGFLPLETPILERYETLSSKYAGGEEILKETFKLKDQGNRLLALRYDLTVPLARFIAMNPQIKLPFKRFQIGQSFRDGPVSSNRIREFTQVDIDTIGSYSMLADAEILKVTSDFFAKLNLKFEIKINNRKVLDSILDELNIQDKNSVILTIDKLDKIGIDEVKKELKEKKLTEKQIQTLFEKIKDKSLKLKNVTGLNELKELKKYLKILKVKNTKIDYSLARGLSYYTSTVFEIFIKNTKEALAAGGRYDNMIGSFLNKEIPAVGISFGLDRIINSIKEEKKTNTKVYIIPLNTLKESLVLSLKLRENNINTEIDLAFKNISKNLEYANKLEIPYVIFLGKEELKKKKYKLRNMKTGKERFLGLTSLIKICQR